MPHRKVLQGEAELCIRCSGVCPCRDEDLRVLGRFSPPLPGLLLASPEVVRMFTFNREQNISKPHFQLYYIPEAIISAPFFLKGPEWFWKE